MRTRALTAPKHMRRDSMRKMTACGRDCHDNRVYLRPRIARTQAIAEGLEDAREYADMDAIEAELAEERAYAREAEALAWVKARVRKPAPLRIERAPVTQVPSLGAIDRLMRERKAVLL